MPSAHLQAQLFQRSGGVGAPAGARRRARPRGLGEPEDNGRWRGRFATKVNAHNLFRDQDPGLAFAKDVHTVFRPTRCTRSIASALTASSKVGEVTAVGW